MPSRSLTAGQGTREGFTSKERDAETGLDYFGARYYIPELGRWNGVDPLSDQYPSHSPYNYVMNNPMRLIDPNGMAVSNITGEYEWENDDWVKKTEVGDDIGVDFYHFAPHKDADGSMVQVSLVKAGGSINFVKNAKAILAGGVIRTRNVNWHNIYEEWDRGSGPVKSIFEGDHQANLELANHELYQNALTEFVESGLLKKGAEIKWGLTDVLKELPANWNGFNFERINMQAQMMGSYNLSFYKIGSRILAIAMDSKSRESFYPWLPETSNFERVYPGEFWLTHPVDINNYNYGYQKTAQGNTYQRYIFWVEQ